MADMSPKTNTNAELKDDHSTAETKEIKLQEQAEEQRVGKGESSKSKNWITNILTYLKVKMADMNSKRNKYAKLKEDHATAKAQEIELQEQLEEQRDGEGESSKSMKRITNISTFHSNDKLDLDKVNINHYFVALSQYYKRRLEEEKGENSFKNPGNPHFKKLLSSPGPKPLVPNPLVPNPKPRGLGLTLKSHGPQHRLWLHPTL